MAPEDQVELAERVRQLEKIQQRFDRGDMLYGRHVVEVLLLENQALAERCRELSQSHHPSSRSAEKRLEVVRRCEVWAKKGTGQGTCDSPLSYSGYCPRWRDHLEED